MTTIKVTPTHYEIDKAYEVASTLQAGDTDWKYKVVEGGFGYARIDIFDEDGEFVATHGSAA
jgi:hypothetical protein